MAPLVFKSSHYLPYAKGQKETNDQFLRKMPNGLTDNDFIGHTVGWGSKNNYILRYIYKNTCTNVKMKMQQL